MLAEVHRAVTAALDAAPGRVLVGIAGPPGAGKSTLAAALVQRVRAEHGGRAATIVAMDGFHLANVELERLGLTDRKGAPETFDDAGFLHLLGRLRAATGDTVYAPIYSRQVHEPIAGATPVFPDTTLVLIEGNYLLLPRGHWAGIRAMLDLAVYLDAAPALRQRGLVQRHRARGLDPGAAREFVLRSDEANARLVAASRRYADLVVIRR